MSIQKKELQRLVLTTLLTGSVLWGGTAVAAENLDEYSLDAVVVTATRTQMTVKEAPSAVEIVDSKKLEQTQAKTLHDALKGALGVNVFNDFQGRSNVSIRGSESRHVLIMVDGKRMGGELSYNSANAWDVDRIRMEDVERVEIIRGPAGALYGSDAIGGVINVITKTPNKTIATINYEYGWYENGKGAGYKSNLYLQGAEKQYSYKINAGLNNNRPYDVFEGNDANFYGKNQPLSLNVGYAFDNGNKLSVDFTRLKEDNQQNDKNVKLGMGMVFGGPSGPTAVPQETKTFTTVRNDNTRTDYTLTYSGNNDKHDWMLRAYKSVYDKDYTKFTDTYKKKLIGGVWGSWTHEKPSLMHDTVKRTLSVIEGNDTISLSEKHRLTAGFEYRQDKSEGTRIKKNPAGMSNVHDAYDEAEINYLAAYVQDEIKPDAKWLVIPSVRYDHSDKFGSEITSQIGTTYNADDDVRIKAVIGQGYKTPTVNELYHYWEMYTGMSMGPAGYRYGRFFEGNPDLQPEKSLSYELAIEKDFGEDSTVHLGVFRNEVKDLIDDYWTGGITSTLTHPGLSGKDYIMTYHNVPEAVLQGVELYGSHKLGKDIYLNAGYTFLDAKDKTAGTRLEDRAKHQVTFGVSYQPENIYAWDLNFDLVSNINYYCQDTERSVMGNTFYKTKNFTIANIMTSRYLNKDTKIYLGIDNISNHQNFGSYSDGNLGRMYRVGMEYKF